MTDIRTIKKMTVGKDPNNKFNTLHQGVTLRDYIDNNPSTYRNNLFTPAGI